MDRNGAAARRDRDGGGAARRRALSVSLAGVLLLGAAGCGDDEPAAPAATEPADATLTTVAPPDEEPAAAALDDEPRDLFARVQVIKPAPGSDEQGSPYAGATILFVDTPEGRPHRILVPGDLDLDDRAGRVLRDPECQGDVDAKFSVVDTPPGEKLGDLLLVDVQISVADC